MLAPQARGTMIGVAITTHRFTAMQATEVFFQATEFFLTKNVMSYGHDSRTAQFFR